MKDLVEFLVARAGGRARRRAGERVLRRARLPLRVEVAPGDMGKVIGKGGRTAKAIRTVVRAAAARQDAGAIVDFVD